MAQPMTDLELQEYLEEQSTKKYYIEYNGFLSNHLAHGVIALHRLGASSSRVKAFKKWYEHKLELGTKNEPIEERSVVQNPDALLGERKQFYALFDYYSTNLEKQNMSLEKLIAADYPKMQLGISGSAFHGLIHLGYGYAVQSKQVVLEGMAYSHYSYTPLIFSQDKPEYNLKNFGQGQVDILDVVEMVRNDVSLTKTMLEVEHSEKWQARDRGRFQRRCQGLLDVAGDRLLELVYKIKFPEWFNPESSDMQQAVKLSDWALDCAIIAYAKSSQQNDFFLLHGVTAVWSIQQVIPALQNYNKAIECIRSYLAALLATYLARMSPPLSVEFNMTAPVSKEEWDETISKTLEMETDEHVYKLVQVCHERCLENQGMGSLYLFAAKCAITYPLVITMPEIKEIDGQ